MTVKTRAQFGNVYDATSEQYGDNRGVFIAKVGDEFAGVQVFTILLKRDAKIAEEHHDDQVETGRVDYGTARLTIDGEQPKMLRTNDVWIIRAGVKHTLENAGAGEFRAHGHLFRFAPTQ